ncbi:hypothetical protein HN592_05100 [Candidatus Woesearchaeota archaeon]|jgi:hypothetical protein|nr:hypothetical protein [Candidatus Woesearchaeota archaeon]MBT4367764.1 hypothetical protein [Candidatus Woesearchaeota archaeon]MBT4712252.1 hypothetical protein [Candidatus Woesearchaeota archaeon]MBT6638800.1 hypothetical protein [Candidatus Woesearchaeota archaeon]MBT7134444.1 hypothetical protein [Candidatus Woesearchaeota archaeon]
MKAKREIAFKVWIKEILNGEYVVKEGWEPNFIEINNKKFSRVNVLGIVIDSSENLIKLDDGTGEIVLRSFNELKLDFSVGDVLLVIGRPREYNEERYVMPEIVKKIEDKNWINVRKLELQQPITVEKPVVKPIKETAVKEQPPIIDLIKELDKGEGVSTESLVDNLGKDSEKIIKKLLEAGEIFEISPGILKILA